ncbi:MAG: M20/M25/M40 family metallo-hydrolase [Acidobacteriota bacterium]
MKNFKRSLRLLLLLNALQVIASAQHASAKSTTPDPELLRRHVTYLASEALEGRSPGTPGADKAAEYLAAEFARLNLGCPTPDLKCRHTGKVRNGYFQELPFVAAVDLGQNNSLSIRTGESDRQVILRNEWMPIGYASKGAGISAPLVFVGYGITAAEVKYDDYANGSARDKIAVAFTGTPDGDNPHGQFARYADSRWKAIAAKDHGARALIVIANEEKFADERLAQLRYDQTAGEAGIPVLVVSRQVAASWFGLGGLAELKMFEKATDKWPSASDKLAGLNASLSVEVTRRTAPAYNVVGILEGTDPKLKGEYIVLGAHYDHLGHGNDSSLAPNSREVHHGADDNASGTAGLVELARILSADRKQLRRSVVFVAFTAEESGLIGSKAYVNNPGAPLNQSIAMVNMDMIGRLRDGKLTVGGIGTAANFRQLVEGSNKGMFALQLNEDGFGPSDHSSFYARQVPVLFFFTGTHDDYHKPSDTAEKINYEGEAKIVGLISDIVRELDRTDARPVYTLAKSQSGGRSSGFRVYLGTVPNYAESDDGMLLDAVREDSPAAKSGLKAGDKIVRLAGREIKNVYDYTYALGEMKGDQEYEVEVVRGAERLKMKLIPQSRR